jgi:hypothetical protein
VIAAMIPMAFVRRAMAADERYRRCLTHFKWGDVKSNALRKKAFETKVLQLRHIKTRHVKHVWKTEPE